MNDLLPSKLLPADELAAELSRNVMRLARRLRNMRDEALELSPGQMSALITLQCHETLTMGELAGHEKVRPPSMTRLVEGLVARGLAERRTCDDDRRAQRVSITPAGREIVLTDRARRHVWLASQLQALSPAEQQTVHDAMAVLEKVIAS